MQSAGLLPKLTLIIDLRSWLVWRVHIRWHQFKEGVGKAQRCKNGDDLTKIIDDTLGSVSDGKGSGIDKIL